MISTGKPWRSTLILSLPSERVVRALDQIIEWRGKPQVIRSDNGPEYISGTFIAWAERQGIRLDHIQPGNPQQNAYIERYNRTVRYDWLSHYLFESIEEVQNYATDWMWTYNHERPNMALGGITPKQKSALLTATLLLTAAKNGGITTIVIFLSYPCARYPSKHNSPFRMVDCH
jgi:transposase InsO family protein